MEQSGKNAAFSKEAQVVDLLIRKGYQITFAESCTGGKAAARLVNVPNASAVFGASFVTYANEAKMKFLGVKNDTIARCGVVSEEVALEMACGAARETGSQVAVGISGIAGPGGAVPGKPVGMVCFGFSFPTGAFSATKMFGDLGRNAVRDESVEFVFDTLLKKLKEA